MWLEDKNEVLLEENETVRQDKGQRNESLPATIKEKNQYSPVNRKLCYELLALKISPGACDPYHYQRCNITNGTTSSCYNPSTS